MIFRAGFALNIAGSLVNGLMPFRERHLVSAPPRALRCRDDHVADRSRRSLHAGSWSKRRFPPFTGRRPSASRRNSRNPKFTIRRVRVAAQSDNPVFLEQRERMIEAMRKAGAPEE